MTKHEMTNDEGSTNDEARIAILSVDFVISSSFVIRHSSFFI